MAKRIAISVGVLAIAAFGLTAYLRGPAPTAFGGPTVELASYSGAKPTGVPASLAQASLIQRGEYLTRAADCEVCHTAKGGAPFAGGFAFQLPFGTIYSTNITPDRATGIGAYTDEQFVAALHQGKRKDGQNLYPAMPFASFSSMTDEDALAIKAYLFSLAPVNAPARANTLSFPFNQRALVGLWSAVFNRNERFAPAKDQTAEWNRGAYLAESLAHCGECHTPRNLAFALDNRSKFSGAVQGGWYAYNISADKVSGIGAWSDQSVAQYLTTGRAEGHGVASGPMGEVVDHSLRYLTPEDIRALAVYTRSVPAKASKLPARVENAAPEAYDAGPSAQVDPQGAKIYAAACASCHGWTGQSPLESQATLIGARSVNDPTGTNVVQAVISGVHRNPPHGGFSMPAFGSTYNDREIAAVANYVTARFGPKGAALDEKDVRSLRQQAQQ